MSNKPESVTFLKNGGVSVFFCATIPTISSLLFKPIINGIFPEKPLNSLQSGKVCRA
ncbi:MAG: hypothetical protein J6Z11_12305 [Candidatus Riflebacteria bacterium]|nr:hypothetical protein [Candidatus Riflebacteria bacterium]